MDIVVMCQPNEYTTLNYKQQGMRDKSKRSRCDENSYQEGDVEMQGICLRQSGSVLSFAILRSGGKLKSVRTPRIAFLQPGTHAFKRVRSALTSTNRAPLTSSSQGPESGSSRVGAEKCK
jgi:hypothetical protein